MKQLDKVRAMIAQDQAMHADDFSDEKVQRLTRDFSPAPASTDPGRDGTAIAIVLIVLGVALIVTLIYLLRVVL